MNNIKMLYYDRIGVSGGIYTNKASELKECNICEAINLLEILN